MASMLATVTLVNLTMLQFQACLNPSCHWTPGAPTNITKQPDWQPWQLMQPRNLTAAMNAESPVQAKVVII